MKILSRLPAAAAAAAIAALSVVTLGGPARAEQGDWIFRLRGINVMPSGSSGDILPAFPGEGVDVDNSFMPEVDITYMVTKNIGLELIAATTKHNALGETGTTGSLGKLASTWVLPPTLTLQYHFLPDSSIRPYIGAGLNYTLFYSEDASTALENAVGATKVSLDDSFGWAAQVGVDFDLTERLFLNLDVKYIDMDTTARLSTTAAGVQRVNISIDPVVAGFGIGIRF